MDLDRLNRLDPDDAHTAFRDCCGSGAWAAAMTLQRPFASLAELLDTARSAWRSLDPADREEAYAAHPRIGASVPGDDRHHAWSRAEQGSVGEAPAGVLERLEECNREYEAKFGRVYLIFATGSSAEELLAHCQARIDNDPETEAAIAADEQEKITDLRLRRLVRID
ncbi:MAG: 2-oxo-4-hydroxy-4-carboxy-5-ureidoimidazoline decarboxylase [Acidimicrobiia bacterium]